MYYISFQVQQKILARGDMSVEDEIADCVCAGLLNDNITKHAVLLECL